MPTVSLRDDLHYDLKKWCGANDKSMTVVIEQCVEWWLLKYGNGASQSSPLRSQVAAAKKYRKRKRKSEGNIDAGALLYHDDRNTDIVLQAITLMQPVALSHIKERVINHAVYSRDVARIIMTLIDDKIIKIGNDGRYSIIQQGSN